MVGRACLFLWRNKGRTIILFAILVAISFLVLVSMMARDAVQTASRELRESMVGYFHIETDIEHGSKEPVDDAMLDDVSRLQGVSSCNGLDLAFMYVEDIQLVPGRLSAEGDPEASLAQVIGNTNSGENEYFTLGMFRLTEGRQIEKTDERRAVISEELAKLNGLSVGDSIKLRPSGAEGQVFDSGVAEIIGIYEMIDSQKTTDSQVAECDMKENLIFTNTSFVRQMQSQVVGHPLQSYSRGAVFYVEDVAQLDEITDQVTKLPGYHWEGYTIDKNNKEYHDMADPLNRMDLFLKIFIAGISVCSTIILGLMLFMWSRDRRYEAGILMSVGIGRTEVVGQYILENALIMLAALPTSVAMAVITAGPLGERIFNLELQLSAAQVAAMAGIGYIILLISTLVACIPVFRMQPKEILSTNV